MRLCSLLLALLQPLQAAQRPHQPHHPQLLVEAQSPPKLLRGSGVEPAEVQQASLAKQGLLAASQAVAPPATGIKGLTGKRHFPGDMGVAMISTDGFTPGKWVSINPDKEELKEVRQIIKFTADGFAFEFPLQFKHEPATLVYLLPAGVDGPIYVPCKEHERPGVPTKIEMKSFSNVGMGLTWDRPGGAGVEKYYVEAQKLPCYGEDKWKPSCEGTTQTCFAEGLDPDSKFQFRIKTSNCWGFSYGYSPSFVFLTPYDTSTSMPPPHLVVSDRESMTVGWNPSDPDGEYAYQLDIKYYDATTADMGPLSPPTSIGSVPHTIPEWKMAYKGLETSYTYKNLGQCASYAFRIRAITPNGPGPFSGPKTFSTACWGPEAPSTPYADQMCKSDVSLFIKWSDPSKASAKPLAYNLEYKEGQTGLWQELYTGLGTSFEKTPLKPKTQYLFRIKVTTDNEAQSEWSPEGSAWTDKIGRFPPGLPEAADITDVTPTSYNMRWWPTPCNGVTSTRLEESCILQGYYPRPGVLDTPFKTISEGAGLWNIGRTGLKPGLPCHYRLQYFNSIGKSAIKEFTAFAQQTPPDEPENFQFTNKTVQNNLNKALIEVQFDRPFYDNGASPVSYRIWIAEVDSVLPNCGLTCECGPHDVFTTAYEEMPAPLEEEVTPTQYKVVLKVDSGKSYVFKMQGVNPLGGGPNTTAICTSGIKPPTQITIIYAVMKGPDFIRFGFEHSYEKDFPMYNGAPPLEYAVSRCKDGKTITELNKDKFRLEYRNDPTLQEPNPAVPFVCLEFGSETSIFPDPKTGLFGELAYTFENLEADSPHMFRTRARNVDGWSEMSPTIGLYTDAASSATSKRKVGYI